MVAPFRRDGGAPPIVSIAVQADSEIRRETRPASAARIVTDGKFLRAGDERFFVKGVTYGTFAPDADGYQFPSIQQVTADFCQMASLGCIAHLLILHLTRH